MVGGSWTMVPGDGSWWQWHSEGGWWRPYASDERERAGWREWSFSISPNFSNLDVQHMNNYCSMHGSMYLEIKIMVVWCQIHLSGHTPLYITPSHAFMIFLVLLNSTVVIGFHNKISKICKLSLILIWLDQDTKVWICLLSFLAWPLLRLMHHVLHRDIFSIAQLYHITARWLRCGWSHKREGV